MPEAIPLAVAEFGGEAIAGDALAGGLSATLAADAVAPIAAGEIGGGLAAGAGAAGAAGEGISALGAGDAGISTLGHEAAHFAGYNSFLEDAAAGTAGGAAANSFDPGAGGVPDGTPIPAQGVDVPNAFSGASMGTTSTFAGPAGFAGGFGDTISALAKNVFGPIGGGFGNVGGIPLGVSPFDLAKGAYGLYQSDQAKKLAQKYAAQADPNAQYRPGYASQLNTLSTDPSSVFNLPGWQAGQEAVQRSMAAQGYNGSGNMAVAMQKYGGDFYNQALQNQGTLAGIGFNPASAGTIGISGNNDALNLAGQSLNSLGYGAAGGAGRRTLTVDDLRRALQ